MKPQFSFIIVLIIFLSAAKVHAQAQTPVYLTFVTHNEENEPYNNFNYYIVRRNVIVQLAEIVVSKGAKWNFQSDWKFLFWVKNFDTGSVVTNTNGKNLIKWLTEDKGIICDPHAHEVSHNYADVAYLHSQLGITPTGVVGGFLYNQIVGGNNWEELEDGIYGRVYTSYFWQPDILWGGGTQNHVNDPQNYGAWKPQSMANFYVHDTSKHLTLIGNGCNNKIYDTSNVSTAIQRIRNIVNAVTYNIFPDSGIYTANVFMSIGQMSITQMNKMSQFIDSMSAFVSQGKIQWKNIQDIYNIWMTSYGKNPFRVSCSSILDAYSKMSIGVIIEGLYNVPTNQLNLKDKVTTYLRNISSPYSIVDSAKANIDSLTFSGNFAFVNASSGTYYLALKYRNGIETWSKSGGEVFTQNSTMNFNFTTSPSQAYGNNLVLKGSKFCVYSGDINQDGIVDANDVSSVDNDALNISSGYRDTDLTGDLIVDGSDVAVADNNAFNFVARVIP